MAEPDQMRPSSSPVERVRPVSSRSEERVADATGVVLVEGLLEEVEERLSGSEASGLLLGVAGGEHVFESFPAEGLQEREQGRVAQCFGGIEYPDVGLVLAEELADEREGPPVSPAGQTTGGFLPEIVFGVRRRRPQRLSDPGAVVFELPSQPVGGPVPDLRVGIGGQLDQGRNDQIVAAVPGDGG